jgi:hypothetical protein
MHNIVCCNLVWHVKYCSLWPVSCDLCDHTLPIWPVKIPFLLLLCSEVTQQLYSLCVCYYWGTVALKSPFSGPAPCPFEILAGYIMYPLTLHLGVQRKLTAFSPRKVVYHAVFCKYYAELAKTFFFCLTLDQTGSGVWPMAFVSVPPFFCNIIYNLSNFVTLMYNIRNMIGPLDTDCWPYLPYLFR